MKKILFIASLFSGSVFAGGGGGHVVTESIAPIGSSIDAVKPLLIVQVSRISMVRDFGSPLKRVGLNKWSTDDIFVGKVVTTEAFGDVTIESVNPALGMAMARSATGEQAQIVEVVYLAPLSPDNTR